MDGSVKAAEKYVNDDDNHFLLIVTPLNNGVDNVQALGRP